MYVNKIFPSRAPRVLRDFQRKHEGCKRCASFGDVESGNKVAVKFCAKHTTSPLMISRWSWSRMSADAKEEWVSARDDRKDTERVLMDTSEVIAETNGKLLDAIHEMRAQLKMPMFEEDENASSDDQLDDQLLRFGRLGDEYESLLPQVDALTGGNEQEEMEEPEEEEKEEPEEEEDVPAAGGGRGGGGSTSGGGGINPNQGNGKGKRKRRQR